MDWTSSDYLFWENILEVDRATPETIASVVCWCLQFIDMLLCQALARLGRMSSFTFFKS